MSGKEEVWGFMKNQCNLDVTNLRTDDEKFSAAIDSLLLGNESLDGFVAFAENATSHEAVIDKLRSYGFTRYYSHEISKGVKKISKNYCSKCLAWDHEERPKMTGQETPSKERSSKTEIDTGLVVNGVFKVAEAILNNNNKTKGVHNYTGKKKKDGTPDKRTKAWKEYSKQNNNDNDSGCTIA